MLGLSSLQKIAQLREGVSIECKLAQGRDGTGDLPEDMWKTYSAFANTRGGYIFLGLRELPDKHYEVAGVARPKQVLDKLWQGLNNPNKVSVNLLVNEDVKIWHLQQGNVISIKVPKAPEQNRPVYLHGAPYGQTYCRKGEADCVCEEHQVQAMLSVRNMMR
ncbi:MAG: ATP-binding protein [Gammaproteobacteria bacterium]|jgi:predicted HTH transcriptional regulator|nr:ATP-binding protein [Gammaproteobacteria bacterium]MCP4879790.1 ATP-binding protein [Gammaproteobacteria bacterium]MDP6166557.1 ATP-binding protein [Gammaproteobacteria bacterium]